MDKKIDLANSENSIKNERSSLEEDIIILGAFNLAPSLRHISETEFKDVQGAIDNILLDYKRLQEEFKQVDHECDRLEHKEIKLEKENAQLKEDIKEMYYKEVVITIMCDNFNLSRSEALELLGDEE